MGNDPSKPRKEDSVKSGLAKNPGPGNKTQQNPPPQPGNENTTANGTSGNTAPPPSASGVPSKQPQPTTTNPTSNNTAEKPKQRPDSTMIKSEIDNTLDAIPFDLSPEDIEIGEFLGEGVYSEVYKGFVYGTPVAVKKFKNQGFNPEVLKEVRKEVRIMKSIRHPNLLLFLGACTKPGHLMIATELMDKSFHDLNKSKVDLLTKMKMAKEAAKGISWLHSNNPAIIHRDLKPENILIDSSGRTVKVADFGLSLVKDHSKQEREEMRKIRGSPAFMSPEALLGSELTIKSDVYSFGMILWELATAGSPYDSLQIESFDQLIEEICVKGTREKIPDTLPSALQKLILNCWQRNPESRPTVLQIIEQLDEAILEAAIGDSKGKKFWRKNFDENHSLSFEVPWDAFLAALGKALKMNTGTKVFAGLKSILCKVLSGRDVVTIEDFGNLLNWCGPMFSDKEEDNFILVLQNLFTKKWFHGDIDTETAETRLAGLTPGTFLIRFSSTPGNYALSKVVEKNSQNSIIHIRITHKPGGNFSFSLNGKNYEFENLDELVASSVLELKDASSGSRYYASYRIKQIHSGYVN